METRLHLVPDPHDAEGRKIPPLAAATGVRAHSRRLRRRLQQLLADEEGAVTAEYAIVILAAVAFAGLLVAIMRSGEIRAMLLQLVENALGAGG